MHCELASYSQSPPCPLGTLVVPQPFPLVHCTPEVSHHTLSSGLGTSGSGMSGLPQCQEPIFQWQPGAAAGAYVQTYSNIPQQHCQIRTHILGVTHYCVQSCNTYSCSYVRSGDQKQTGQVFSATPFPLRENPGHCWPLKQLLSTCRVGSRQHHLNSLQHSNQ